MGKVHWNRSDVKVPEADVKTHGGKLPIKAVSARGKRRADCKHSKRVFGK